MIYAAIFAATSAFTFLCLVLIEQIERWGDLLEQYDESALSEPARHLARKQGETQ